MYLEEINQYLKIDHLNGKDLEITPNSLYMGVLVRREEEYRKSYLDSKEHFRFFEECFNLELIKSVFELKHNYTIFHFISMCTAENLPKYKIILKRIL